MQVEGVNAVVNGESVYFVWFFFMGGEGGITHKSHFLHKAIDVGK